MKSKEKSERKKLEPLDYTKKERLLMAALLSLAVSFTYFFYGPIDIYANNMAELAITFKDIILPITLTFVGSFVVITGILFLFKSHLLNIVTAVIISLFISGVIDNNITNKVVYTSGDVSPHSDRNGLIFFVTYFIIMNITAIVSVLLKKKWKNALIFLCVLLFGTNAAALTSDFITKDLVHDNSINCDYVISKKGLFEVSGKENIIVILFDRLDTKFYDVTVKRFPGYFDNLEGFTYYNSATTSYSRTFPAVTSLITNTMYLNDISPEEYFDYAYSNSPFLSDLKKNGYNTNLYINKYYEYADAKVMKDYVSNAEKVTDYKPNIKSAFGYLTELSYVRNFSYYFSQTSLINATSARTSEISELVCDDGIFRDDDEAFYKELKAKGLSASEYDKNFTFIYLHGSHTPIILDENCEKSEDATVSSQTAGSFKIVYEYLEQLKKLGVYDNSTIIITADHGYAISDEEDYFKVADSGITAAMFVKPKNAEHEKLVTSDAEVSITNLIPFAVQDAKLETDNDYGKSVTDIKEGEHQERTLYQCVYSSGHKLCLNEYKINGDAKDLKNWKLTQKIKSNYAFY
jgi:hypothetical protein